MKILILGASGLVGKALTKELSSTYEVYGTYNQTKLEIADSFQLQWNIDEYKKISDWIEKINPNIIISCLRGDFTTQLEAHKNIVDKIKSTSTKFLFCSTTNVFDGEVTKHHAEDDLPRAESDYGQFKINCENLIKEELGERGIVLRLPMVWGQNSPRLNEIKDKIKNALEIEAYENIYLNHAIDNRIAKQARMIIENGLTGTFHLATAVIESQYAFINNLVTQISSEAKVKSLKLENVEEYNFGLLINRNDLPSDFNYQNETLINELLN